MQLVKDASRHLERAPDPGRSGVVLLHLNLEHPALIVRHDRVEKLRLLDGKEEERKLVVGQAAQAVHRKPDRVRQTDQDRFFIAREWSGAEQRITKAGRL